MANRQTQQGKTYQFKLVLLGKLLHVYSVNLFHTKRLFLKANLL